MVQLLYMGATYRKTPVEVRERLALKSGELDDTVRSLRQSPAVMEVYPLSTCNRTEFYVVHTDRTEAERRLGEFFRERSAGAIDPARQLDVLEDLEAGRHLFEVAAGLDSMIMGEPQILGQVKEFYEAARQGHCLGVVLDRLLRAAVTVGKRARDETEIGLGAVSVSFAAVELARKIFGELAGKTAALIGVGEMGTLCARHLLGEGVHRLFLLNRTFERSVDLAQEMGGSPVPIEELYATIAHTDIVISATAAPGFVVEAAPIRKLLTARRQELLLVDIAIPRDIEPAVGELPNVFLYDIDDFEIIIDANQKKRLTEAKKVRAIIAEELDAFACWLESLEIKPVIVSLRSHFEAIRSEEIGSYKNLTERERQLLERVTRAFMNKLLHHPITKLKGLASEEEKICCAQALNTLFVLDSPEGGKESEKNEP